MEEKDKLKSKLFKHILYNILIFISIFIIFGLFLFFMIKSNIYSSVDKQLYEAREKIIESNLELNFIISSNILTDAEKFLFFNDINENISYTIARKIANPNIFVLVRDKDGNIISENLGRFEDYTDEIIFNDKNLDKTYETSIDDEYYYRGINFLISSENDENSKYVQFLININSERNLVNGYFQIISYATIFVCFLSVFASYIVSERTLKPLSENLIKQMEFVQNVSHELRTPLTIIQAKQELLLQEPDAKIIDKSEEISLTLNETKRLSKLVKDLLILSRADNNKINLQKENVNIDDFIKEILAPYIEIAEMEEKQIILNLNYKVDIDVDTNKFYQLMIILLDNAIKYTESQDTIELNTYLKDNKCVIEVKDTGIGISDEGLERVFERFYREDKARNRETGGTGLGLSIAKLIVSEHGGTIKATHNTPKGTIFTIKLPR